MGTNISTQPKPDKYNIAHLSSKCNILDMQSKASQILNPR